MTKLEDRIRTGLHAAAQQLPETAERIATVEPQSRSPRRVRGPLVGVAVMVGVLVVGGLLMWISTLGGPDRRHVADTAAPAQIDRFPVPGYVPVGAELVYGDYAVSDPANPDSVDAVIARPTAEGFTDGVVVTTFDSSQVAIEIPEGEPVEVNGQSATLVRSKGGVTLWWQQSDRVVAVRAPSGDAGLAETVAAAVGIADAGPFGPTVVSFGTLPDGFSVFAAPRLASRQAHPYVSIQTPIGPETVEPEVATIAVLDDSLYQVAGAFGTATTVEIAGVDGFLVEQDTRTAFIWSLSPTLTVTVSGTYPLGDIRAIAEDLEFVTETDWRRQYDNTGPQLPTTTSTQAVPVTEPPAVGTHGNEPGAPSTTIP
jgi:hypothetical protein